VGIVGTGGTAAFLATVAQGARHFEALARRLTTLDEAAIVALSHDLPALALA